MNTCAHIHTNTLHPHTHAHAQTEENTHKHTQTNTHKRTHTHTVMVPGKERRGKREGRAWIESPAKESAGQNQTKIKADRETRGSSWLGWQ